MVLLNKLPFMCGINKHIFDHLKKKWHNRYFGFVIDGEEIIPLYDFPHLLKGVRNNLLVKDLHFVQDGIEKVARWKHIQQFYLSDKAEHELRLCPKLTDFHVIPETIKKMKVACASQVFSQRVAASMKCMSRFGGVAPNECTIDHEASQTAELLLFFDKLFDSVNGNDVRPQLGKELRSAISSKSQHILFWDAAIDILRSMYFKSPNSNKTSVPPSLNWIFSLRGLKCIWKRLQEDGFKYLLPRRLNQDPLENFFGCIRSHGVRNTNPTCNSFVSSFKSLLINNFLSPHSAGCNCQAEDGSAGVLDTFKTFVTENEEISFIPPEVHTPVFESSSIVRKSSFLGQCTKAYVAGYVASKICIKTKSCLQCRNLLTSTNLSCDAVIVSRAYHPGLLKTPSTNFMKYFQIIVHKITETIPATIALYGVKQRLIQIVMATEMPSTLFCEQHKDLISFLIRLSVNIILFSYVKDVNRHLNGQNARQESADALKSLANKVSNKRNKKK